MNRLGLFVIAVSLSACGLNSRLHQTQATKTATELRTALMNFYTEYRSFPQLEDVVEGEDWTGEMPPKLAAALIADDTDLNPRGILFFGLGSAKETQNAAPRLQDEFQVFDPWGNPFHLSMDTDRDNKVAVPDLAGGEKEIEAWVAVWSCGPDGTSGTADDITSF